MTSDAALLVGLHFAMDLPASCRTFPRQIWPMKVLVEQLSQALPAGTPSGGAVEQLVDQKRGVTSARISRATEHLLDRGFLEPDGVGAAAVWRITGDRIGEVLGLVRSLSAEERLAMSQAAQRTAAICDAWSNRPRASGQSTAGTSRSSRTRRHPAPLRTRTESR